jgi:hypothetical protein
MAVTLLRVLEIQIDKDCRLPGRVAQRPWLLAWSRR